MYVKWEAQEVKQEAGGEKALYQQLVDMSLDHNLERVVNIPTRGENIHLMFTLVYTAHINQSGKSFNSLVRTLIDSTSCLCWPVNTHSH